jgi:peptidoglycan/xylan/chitin deacetylase (PgdA/CDA1 family)
MHRVVLTFDDGPDPEHTPRILDVLAKERVQALFFILGMRLETPGAIEIVRRAAREGHLIGNHSYGHHRLNQLPADQIASEILKTHHLIAELEPKRKLFRPPFGASNKTVDAIARKLGYRTVLWNVDSADWKEENKPSGWVGVALKQIQTRYLAICLCHDYGHTADHLQQLIERTKMLSRSQFVRYDERKSLTSMVRGWWGSASREVGKRIEPA